MATTNSKPKRITFLDLPTEMRQEVLLASLNDDELQRLLEMDVHNNNKNQRVFRNLDCRIDFNKQVAALRAVDLAVMDDVEFAKHRWLESHGGLMAKWEKLERGCWTSH
ncbi:hypothetical protein E2P81_ATG06759 [Venturia nashicola]|nr:hypothetical protein E2P81_ATG06759 [Venturia nashicola]